MAVRCASTGCPFYDKEERHACQTWNTMISQECGFTEEKMSLEADTDQTMRDLANHVKGTVGDGYGFVVLVFPFGEPGVANYISNGSREDMITALREKADVLEAKKDIPVDLNIKMQ